MLGAGIGRGEEEEDEIDRQSVDRLEIDRLREPREIAEHAAQPLDLPVRNRGAGAEAGRADLLARIEAGDDVPRREAGQPRRGGGELLDQRLLVGGDQIVVDRLGGKDGGKVAHLGPIGLGKRPSFEDIGGGAGLASQERCGSTQPIVPSPRR